MQCDKWGETRGVKKNWVRKHMRCNEMMGVRKKGCETLTCSSSLVRCAPILSRRLPEELTSGCSASLAIIVSRCRSPLTFCACVMRGICSSDDLETSRSCLGPGSPRSPWSGVVGRGE